MRGIPGRALVTDLTRVVDAVLRDLLGAGDPEHDDLIQCSLEYVLKTVDNGSYRGDCALETWAATLARNVAIDRLRSRSRDRRLFVHDESVESLSEIPSTERGPDHVAEMRRRVREIEAAMERLAPAKARVVYLHDALGYQLAEIATTVGISVAAAQSRLVRGRREIIDCIVASGRHDGDEPDGTPPSSKVRARGSSPPAARSAVPTSPLSTKFDVLASPTEAEPRSQAPRSRRRTAGLARGS
jgi:RNA polymerase sigma-70 factor, ECF subfamily